MSRIEDRTVESLNTSGVPWTLLERLNSFLERVYLQADVETGC
jgi:hypothetical protein